MIQHISANLRLEGTNAQVRRLFPSSALHWPATDPFLLFDEFFVQSYAGFPDHPHRGFEIISYIIEGGLEHRDSLGNHEVASAVHAMHFVTGSGVIHSEMPLEMAHGLQLWINLPRRIKNRPPSLKLLGPDNFPVTHLPCGMIRHIASPEAAIILHTPVWYDDVDLHGATTHCWETTMDITAFVYVLTGNCLINETITANAGELVITDTDELLVSTDAAARYVVLRGQRQHESVHFHGPFVD